jgi:tRNA U34 5-methylaminomethyl-2-thiouridine-forming methyltransferase MnmC
MDAKKERFFLTADGSNTLWNEQLQQWYHSINGAIDESMRVYIDLGLWYVMSQKKQIRLLEMGLGTGLNAWLTWQEAEKYQLSVQYTGIEAYPISLSEAKQLNYGDDSFMLIHDSPDNQWLNPSSNFGLYKVYTTLESFESNDVYDLIYYDAFAYSSQPELWSIAIFQKLYHLLSTGGVLTTYSSKGIIQRNLKEAGFIVEKHKGPHGKKHILRAIKKM